jgi:hypothetical protein
MPTKVRTGFWMAWLVGAVAASPVMAGDDAKYPGYDFNPTVVYRSDDLKYPGFDFNPTVIYSNPELIAQATALNMETPASSAAEEAHAPDPKYPAAYFTPTIIHPGTANN